MKYFEYSADYDPITIGVTHGAGQFSMGVEFDKNHPWYDDIFFTNPRINKDWWKIWSKMPEYGNKLIGLKMDKKAKHTDIMDTAGFMRGFIVSERLRNILESFNLPNHKFFETNFIQNKTIINEYWWFCYDMETGETTVDFVNSEFDIAYHFKEYGKEYFVSSYEEYINVFYQTGEALKAKKLVFNQNFNSQLDVFGTQFLSNRKAYMSERLLNQMNSYRITGYRVREPVCPLIFS
jgi:hypothetical protein